MTRMSKELHSTLNTNQPDAGGKAGDGLTLNGCAGKGRTELAGGEVVEGAEAGGEFGGCQVALAVDSREPEWSVYSGALGRKFLRLDQFLKSNSAKAEGNVPNQKLFQ